MFRGSTNWLLFRSAREALQRMLRGANDVMHGAAGRLWRASHKMAGYRFCGAKICLVSHDAHRHGAQLLLLNLAQLFAKRFGCRLHIIMLGSGALVSQFHRYGVVHRIDNASGADARRLITKLKGAGVRSALCNTTASGLFAEQLTQQGVRCVSLVHELPEIIAAKHLGEHAAALARAADVVIFASEAVSKAFPACVEGKVLVRPQGIASRRRLAPEDCLAFRNSLLTRLGTPITAKIVLGVGYGDRRKGIDIFVDAGVRLSRSDDAVHFIWVGDLAPEMRNEIETKLSASSKPQRFTFVPFTKDVGYYYDVADLFALTSREDPFPSVVIEALNAGLPCVAFADAGGFDTLLSGGAGRLVSPLGDSEAFAAAVGSLLALPTADRQHITQHNVKIAGDFSMNSYAFYLAELLDAAPSKVSVVVPTHNYARYLRERLGSILGQTAPVYEIIVIDDCSTDGSAALAQSLLQDSGVDFRVIENEAKSSSVFEQWHRGVHLARGEFVWIAEADDRSAPSFLEAALRPFSDAQVVLSYTQSRQIDADGKVLDSDYLTYLSDIDAERWRSDFTADGAEEATRNLSIKNTIPNVSGCVFRREALLKVLDENIAEICRLRSAGDWLTYVRLSAEGKFAFIARALNDHRRHATSVTASATSRADHIREIREMQTLVAREFSVSAETKARAEAYIAKLEAQFGLN